MLVCHDSDTSTLHMRALLHLTHLETLFFSAKVIPSAIVSIVAATKKLPDSFITLAMYGSEPICIVPRPIASKYGCNLCSASAGPAGAQSTCPDMAAGGRPNTGAQTNSTPALETKTALQ